MVVLIHCSSTCIYPCNITSSNIIYLLGVLLVTVPDLNRRGFIV